MNIASTAERKKSPGYCNLVRKLYPVARDLHFLNKPCSKSLSIFTLIYHLNPLCIKISSEFEISLRYSSYIKGTLNSLLNIAFAAILEWQVSCRFFKLSWLNPLHLKISMFILHTVLATLLRAMWRINPHETNICFSSNAIERNYTSVQKPSRIKDLDKIL